MRFHFGDHVLDLERRELHRDGAPIALEPQVFDLLVHLIRNRDRVLSKEDLIASVWRGRTVSATTITSRINAARQATGDDGSAQRVIRTIARRGVRFVADVREEVSADVREEVSADVREQVSADVREESSAHVRAEAPPASVAAAVAPVSAKPPLALSEKPSIAVLPFTNMSSDPEQGFLAEGMAQDIITALCRSRSLMVIARNSSFKFADRMPDIGGVGRDLGVRYLLEGSVRRGGNRVRTTARLIDIETGGHLWAEQFDGDLAGMFAVQDDITHAIVRAIGVAVSASERWRSLNKPIENLSAWELYQRGLGVGAASTMIEASPLFERAIEINPTFVPPYAILAGVRISDGTRGSRPLDQALALAGELIQTATGFDPGDPDLLARRSWLTMLYGDRDGGLRYADEAIDAAPSCVHAHLSRGRTLAFHGKPDLARLSLSNTKRLSPFDHAVREADMLTANCYYFEENYPAAETVLRSMLELFPNYNHLHRWLVPTLGQLGRRDDARAALRVWADLAPMQVELLTQECPPWVRDVDHAHFLDGLRKAGWNG